MWRMMKRPKTRLAVLTVLAAVAVGIGVAWIVVNTTGRATSEEGSPVAGPIEPPQITPPPDATLPALAPYPPPPRESPVDTTRTERPGPGLPLLPKHDPDLEPEQGVVPLALPEERIDPDPKYVPQGWEIIDNQMFRFTLAVPPDWYVNMLPEGGVFEIISPVALHLLARSDRGEAERAGVEITFITYQYQPGGQDPTSKALANPNASFNGIPGAIWEESPTGDPTVLRMIRAAFVRYEYVFSAKAWFGEGYTESDVATVEEILASITPY